MFVSYIRVSTARQGRSGLGLEAQQEAVRQYLNGVEPIAEFVEVETGKGANALAKRPELAAAIALAKKSKATLIIAKLDRLARNVHFISGLMESGVEFVAVDVPQANRFTLHIMAAVAEQEARTISERTKAALAAVKARGKPLGTHGVVQGARNRADALDRLAPVADRLKTMKAEGLTVRAMVAKLNEDGVTSPGGGKWHPSSLQKALGRAVA